MCVCVHACMYVCALMDLHFDMRTILTQVVNSKSYYVAVIQICFYGRHVFMGNIGNKPKTEETIDSGGWLHTGDIGNFDEVNNM